MLLKKVKQFFLHNKGLSYLVISVVAFSLFGDFAFAVNTAGSPTVDANKDANTAIAIFNNVIVVASTIVGLLSSLISLLLHPGWVNGTIFGFETYLKEIWILISNVVYFIFAFILIMIAFMNIVGKGEGNWQLKQALPKFVMGVLIVPFSWFFVQFILSISAILTVSVLNLPYDVLSKSEMFTKEVQDFKVCTTYKIDLAATAKETPGFNDITKNCDEITVEKLLKGESPHGGGGMSGSVFGLINIYTYSIMSTDSLDKLSKATTGKTIKTFADLGIKLIIDVLFLVIFLIILVALFLALFSRGVWLWVHAMFSPVYGLFFFFGNEKGGDLGKKINPLEFVKLALVPVYVAAALSFGLIFMFAAGNGMTKIQGGEENPIFKSEDGGTSLTVGGFKLIVKGTVANEQEVSKASFLNKLAGEGGNALGKLIIQLFGLAMLWLAVMAALKSSDITNSVTEPIQQFGKSVGTLIASSPKYAPIIPTPGGMVSTTGLNYAAGNISSKIEQGSRESGNKIVNSVFGDPNGVAFKSDQAMTQITNVGADDATTAGMVSSAIGSAKDAKELATNPKFLSMFKRYGDDMLKVLGKEGEKEKFNKYLESGNAEDVAKGIFMIDKAMEESAKTYSPISAKTGGKDVMKATEQWLDQFTKKGGGANLTDEDGEKKPNLTASANVRDTAVTNLQKDFKGVGDGDLKIGGITINNSITAEQVNTVSEKLIEKDYIKKAGSVEELKKILVNADSDLDKTKAGEIAKAVFEKIKEDDTDGDTTSG